MRPSTVGALCLSAAMGLAVFAYSTITATARDTDYVDGQTIRLDAFEGLSLSGGGTVTVRRGTDHSVTIIEGAESLALEMKRGSLEIRCIRPCPRNATRTLEVTVATLDAIAVTGGGALTIADDFPEQDELNVAVTGGGTLKAYAIPAREVNAAVTGGGSLQVQAIDMLNAAVMGGGSIRYMGDPEVSSAAMGGGSISKR